MKHLPTLACLAAIASAALVSGSGCTTAHEPRDLMSEEARADHDRPVAMKGEGELNGGNLHVVATIARGFQRSPGKHNSNAPRVRKGWFNKDTDAYKEDYNFDYGTSEEDQKEAIQDYIRQAMARRAAGSPMPPVTLHVTFENRGQYPIEIAADEVDSDLGNFAARPSKLALKPGEKGSLDPMVSQLGVTSDEIPVTVVVHVNGKSESQVILVKNILLPGALPK